MSEETKNNYDKKNARPMTWLIYLGLLLGGLLMLGDVYHISHLDRWTARIGIALVYTALALMVGNGRNSGYVGTAIIWLSLVVTIFVG